MPDIWNCHSKRSCWYRVNCCKFSPPPPHSLLGFLWPFLYDASLFSACCTRTLVENGIASTWSASGLGLGVCGSGSEWGLPLLLVLLLWVSILKFHRHPTGFFLLFSVCVFWFFFLFLSNLQESWQSKVFILRFDCNGNTFCSLATFRCTCSLSAAVAATSATRFPTWALETSRSILVVKKHFVAGHLHFAFFSI